MAIDFAEAGGVPDTKAPSTFDFSQAGGVPDSGEDNRGVIDKTTDAVKNYAGEFRREPITTTLKTVAAPFEAAGEAVRSFPPTQYVKGKVEEAAGLPVEKPDYNFRAPTILQETGLAKKTKEPPADPVAMATSLYQGVLRGVEQPIINAQTGSTTSPLKAAVSEAERPKNTLGDIGLQIGTGLMMGKVGTAPIDATLEGAAQIKNFTANKAFSAVEKYLPGFSEFWQKLPRVAASYLIKDPKLTLDPNNGSLESIERIAMKATDRMQGYIANQAQSLEQKARDLRVPLVQRTEQFGEEVAKDVGEKGQAIGDLKSEKGAILPFEKKRDLVLHPYKETIHVMSPENVFVNINNLKNDISGLDTERAMEMIHKLKLSAIKSLEGSAEFVQKSAFDQISKLFHSVPGTAAEKYETLRYVREKINSDALTQKFNTPGQNPTLQEITKQQIFLEKYSERVGSEETFKKAIATRSAINEFEINWKKVKGQSPAETVRETDKYIAELYAGLNSTLDNFPELADARSADHAFSHAKDAARRLDGVFDNPEKFEKFLSDTFENEGSKVSRQRIADLQALEDRVKSSKPEMQDFNLVNDFRKQYQQREQVLKMSPDFQKEFANPQEAQKTLEGFFRMSPKQEGYAVAKDKLEKLKKIKGMEPIIDDAFKHLSAKTYKEWVGGRGVPFWVTRLAFAVGADAAMSPFTQKISTFAIRAGLMTTGDLVALSPKVTGKVMGLSAVASEYANQVLSPSMKARQALLIGSKLKGDNQ